MDWTGLSLQPQLVSIPNKFVFFPAGETVGDEPEIVAVHYQEFLRSQKKKSERNEKSLAKNTRRVTSYLSYKQDSKSYLPIIKG